MCNCNNTYQTTICQPQIPCDQTDCSCPVKDLSTDCILYTGDALECSGIEGQTILTELIQQLDAYICTALAQANSSINLINVGTGVQIYKGVDVLGKREIRSLKTTNPIITIDLAGESKEIAFGIDEDELTSFITNNTSPGLQGSGIQDYLARWTPNGTTLGIGLIRDNGSTIGVNTAPATNSLFKVVGAFDNLISSNNTKNGAFGSVTGNSNGTGALENYGAFFTASNSSTLNVGTFSSAIDVVAGENIGLMSTANNSLTNNYAIQLQDPTVGVGKFLKSITYDGKANWANIVVGDIKSGTSTLGQVITSDGAGNSTWTTPTSSGLSGSGTNNYVAKWTPNGTQLGDSQIRDDGNTVGVNVAPNSGVQFFVTSTKNIGIYSTMTGTGDSIGVGTYINGASTRNVGIEAQVTAGSKNIGLNLGVAGPLYIPFTNFDHGIISATRATGKGNIGGYFIAEGGTSNYALALKDGTEGIGKVLTCATNDGKANWADPTTPNLQKVITTSYALTDVDDGYTIFINNNTTPISISLGTITIANFCVGFIQEGSADVTFSGVTNPVGLKSKGQGYQTFIERKLSTSTYYLLGNTKL